ncbi:hypothetical protein [Desertivirga arenae]|uniref:hypothetical protein n=1 Tax=Desertivirga arenae TaxID=2810309 RepID=UPI001A966BCD|nr:hypothetical protein [Pedobacter sp. SYSU D00823]
MSIAEPVITDLKSISSSYVLIWNSLLTRLPDLDQEFLKLLFNKPELTHTEKDDNGFQVAEMQVIEPPKDPGAAVSFEITPAVLPRIVLNRQRFLNYDNDLQRLLATHDKFRDKLIEFDPKFVEALVPVQMGLNLEFEVVLDDDFVAKEWFYSKIFGVKCEQQNAIFTQEIKYAILHASGNVTNVSVQPRYNNVHSLFISINDHFSISPFLSFVDSSHFKVKFEECINGIKTNIIPFLLKGK